MSEESQKGKKEKKLFKPYKSQFNRTPISPPKGWKEKYKLPAQEFRMIPQ